MAHLRGRILSKNGESTRLGNKRDGMIVEIYGNGWRLDTKVMYCEMRKTDLIHIARVDQATGSVIGDIIVMECAPNGAKR